MLRSLKRLIKFFWEFYRALDKIKHLHWKENPEFLNHLLSARQDLFKSLVDMLGVKVHITKETIPGEQKIFVSNHRSWVDVLITMSEFPCLAIGKSEVRNGPIVGEFLDRTGTLFVKREVGKKRHRALLQMEEVLKDGHDFLIFPEGTTHFKETTSEFGRGIFHLAAKYQIPIVPITIEYRDKSLEWRDKDNFVSNFLRNFKKKTADAFMDYGRPIVGSDRKDLLRETKSVIDTRLEEFRHQLNDIELSTS